MKKLPILLTIIVFLLLSFQPISAECDLWCQLGKLDKKIQEYQAKIADLQSQERNLESQITYMNYQIELTQLEIREKKTEIKLLGEDIGDLSQRLERIASLLEFQEETFVARARSAYIADHLSPFDIALGSENLDEAIRRIKYLEVLETQDREVLEQIRDVRTNYRGQKADLEDRKASVEKLKEELESKEASLAQQRVSKESLLVVTQNDEAVYQRLLQQAKAQAAAIRALVSVRGGCGTCLASQTYCNSWGCYYNQRDCNWHSRSLGYSGLSVGCYGCLVSSVAMIARHYDRHITPADIAATPSAFFANTAWLNYNIVVKGVAINRISYSGYAKSVIDSELAAGRPVIVGLYSGPAHFVVLKKKKSGGYIMNDPWYARGHDIPFSRYYSVGNITKVNVVRVY